MHLQAESENDRVRRTLGGDDFHLLHGTTWGNRGPVTQEVVG